MLGNHPVAAEIEHMKEQEQHHLDTFENLLNDHEARPSVMSPLWNGAGFMLGAVTAAMGPKAAMACTIAVEEVIGEHYQDQVNQLDADHDDRRSSTSSGTRSSNTGTRLSIMMVKMLSATLSCAGHSGWLPYRDQTCRAVLDSDRLIQDDVIRLRLTIGFKLGIPIEIIPP